jgi:hypothetical protein
MLTPPRSRENTPVHIQRSPKVQDKENAPIPRKAAPRKQPSARSLACKSSPLGDRTIQMRNAENSRPGALNKKTETDRSTGSVRDRMREWELERARLREMERVGEWDAQDTEPEAERPVPVRKPSRLRDNVSEVPPSPGMLFRSARVLSCMVTIISVDACSSPTRTNDPFARTMSSRLFKPIQESSVPPSSMPPLPGTVKDLHSLWL